MQRLKERITKEGEAVSMGLGVVFGLNVAAFIVAVIAYIATLP